MFFLEWVVVIGPCAIAIQHLKGKYKSSKGKGKGERTVTVSSGTDARQQRTSDRRDVIKQKMLSTVLPKIADLSIDGSDTLFEVLSQGAKLTQADVKKFIGKPTTDRKRLVLIHYKARWESYPESREIWPADRTELTNAIKEWSNQRFIERSSGKVGQRWAVVEQRRAGTQKETVQIPAELGLCSKSQNPLQGWAPALNLKAHWGGTQGSAQRWKGGAEPNCTNKQKAKYTEPNCTNRQKTEYAEPNCSNKQKTKYDQI